MKRPVEVVIVGGGTAGWMAAAGLASLLPRSRCHVRLVESEEIGIVGVGEATLPHMKHFNDAIGIDEAAMMRRTKATFKLGIEFVDWGFKGASYIHPFGVHGPAGSGHRFHHQWLRGVHNGASASIEDYSFAIAASRRNRFDFPSQAKQAINSTYGYAYHFDASLYAAFLREFAEQRGVERTEGKLVEVNRNDEAGNKAGDIRSITMASGEEIAGDLFIDCSGFRSLLLGDALGVGWEDWSQWLPCDRAFAVPTERAGDLTPYTRSTARSAGWQWRIPLQHRTGNGYVFSSRFIAEEDARAELLANLDSTALDEPRLLRFQAGRRTHSWHRNCIALGLASGFLEPLESTSIYLIQVAVMHLLPLFPDRSMSDPLLAAEFNRRMDGEYERIRDFLILHYRLTSRDDSELWRYCRSMEVPESLERKMAEFAHRGFVEEYKDGLFTPPSWLSVFIGQGLQPRHYHPQADVMPLDKLLADLEQLREEIDDRVGEMPRHDRFIERYCGDPRQAVHSR